jgi:hypothetical protein
MFLPLGPNPGSDNGMLPEAGIPMVDIMQQTDQLISILHCD